MKDLTLVPLGGLCNRLRALVSARCLLSYDPALRIQVVWAPKTECAARFDELFEDNLTIAGRFAFRSAGFLDAPAVLRRNLRLPALLRRLRHDGQYADFHSAAAPAECLAHFCAAQRVYISTGSPLCSTPAAEWGVLSPLPALRRRIASLVNSFGKNTIGVHIRRTDNEKSWHVSPLSAFVREMQAALAEDPEVTFYLATDDEGVREHLCVLFPGRILSQVGASTRSTREGMEAAVVDLFVLSKTCRLIGSYWSSFTDTAAELGNLPLTIARG